MLEKTIDSSMKKNYNQSVNLYITNVIYYIHYITYYTFYMWPLEKEEGNVREFISPMLYATEVVLHLVEADSLGLRGQQQQQPDLNQ